MGFNSTASDLFRILNISALINKFLFPVRSLILRSLLIEPKYWQNQWILEIMSYGLLKFVNTLLLSLTKYKYFKSLYRAMSVSYRLALEIMRLRNSAKAASLDLLLNDFLLLNLI